MLLIQHIVHSVDMRIEIHYNMFIVFIYTNLYIIYIPNFLIAIALIHFKVLFFSFFLFLFYFLHSIYLLVISDFGLHLYIPTNESYF